MKREDAATYAREMANAVASVYQNEGLQPEAKRMEQFHSAAFAQASEFIPDTALVTVLSITEAEGQPLLVAIDGQQFYKLSFDAFEFRSDDVPITICEMTQIDPASGYVRVDAQYDPTSSLSTPSRLTSWTFVIDGETKLAFQTRFDPRDEAGPQEKFARALAEALGWRFSGGE